MSTAVWCGAGATSSPYAHIGPEVADRAKRFAGNNLALQQLPPSGRNEEVWHPLFGLFGAFPHYSARLGAGITIEDRINSCMTRSMNGRPLPVMRRRCKR